MKQLLVVYGMKRSGNHAIINWIRAQQRFEFLNDVIRVATLLREGGPLSDAAPEPKPFDVWLNDQLARSDGLWGMRRVWRLLRRPHRRRRIREGRLLVSTEDLPLSITPFVDPPCPATRVLIVRDPYNLLASRFRRSRQLYPHGRGCTHGVYPREPGPALQRVVDTWKDHARAVLGDVDVEPVCGGSTDGPNRKLVSIYFNRWFSDRDARVAVSRALDLPFSDDGLSDVASYGGGSSFDGRSYDGRARAMDVLSRYDQLAAEDRAVIDGLVADDPEIDELAARLDAQPIDPVP